jgi:hypothetical protein
VSAVRLVNIGYGNIVIADRVVAVISPDSAPMKRFKDEARKAGRLIDGTQGRRTRSILITDSHHIVLSALQTETVAERLAKGGGYIPASVPAAQQPLPLGNIDEPPIDNGDSAEGVPDDSNDEDDVPEDDDAADDGGADTP